MTWFYLIIIWAQTATTLYMGWLLHKSRRLDRKLWTKHGEQLREVEHIADQVALNVERDEGNIPPEGVRAVRDVATLIGWQAYFTEVYAGLHDDDVLAADFLNNQPTSKET